MMKVVSLLLALLAVSTNAFQVVPPASATTVVGMSSAYGQSYPNTPPPPPEQEEDDEDLEYIHHSTEPREMFLSAVKTRWNSPSDHHHNRHVFIDDDERLEQLD